METSNSKEQLNVGPQAFSNPANLTEIEDANEAIANEKEKKQEAAPEEENDKQAKKENAPIAQKIESPFSANKKQRSQSLDLSKSLNNRLLV